MATCLTHVGSASVQGRSSGRVFSRVGSRCAMACLSGRASRSSTHAVSLLQMLGHWLVKVAAVVQAWCVPHLCRPGLCAHISYHAWLFCSASAACGLVVASFSFLKQRAERVWVAAIEAFFQERAQRVACFSSSKKHNLYLQLCVASISCACLFVQATAPCRQGKTCWCAGPVCRGSWRVQCVPY